MFLKTAFLISLALIFSLANGQPAGLEDRIDPALYHQMRDGLNNARIKFEREKTGRVAFLGGSITYNPGWRDQVCEYLREWFPDTKFEFIAAGISSMGTTPGAFRLARDVLSKGSVDLLFEEAAVNDRYNGRSDQEQIRAMEGIVRHARHTNPAMDIVIMHFVDPLKMEDYHRGDIPREIQNHEKVAAHYQVPTINLAKEVTDRIDAGEFSWENDFKDLHPSPFGQHIYFRSIKTLLENAWKDPLPSEATIQAHALPEKTDPFSYDRGAFLPIEKAKKKKGWMQNSNWKPEDGASTRAGFTDVPMLIATEPGASFQLAFKGPLIGMAIAAGPDAGIIEYSIDRAPFQTLDLFTQWSAGLHLPWYHVLAADLSPEKHTLRLRISDQKNAKSKGHACRIKSFVINQ